MIDYARLDRSLNFYQEFGFERIESPWTVTKAISNIAKPSGGKDSFFYIKFVSVWEIVGKDKVLVASGEQSFLYCLKNHNISLEELISMKEATKKAFNDGTRSSRD